MTSTFKDFFRNTASRVAESLHLPSMRPKPKSYQVDGKLGKKGQPYRRTIGYKRQGPFYIQVGVRPDGLPLMARQFFHRFLHATKGWRTRVSPRTTATLANMSRHRYYGPQTEGYVNRYGHWVYPTSAKKDKKGYTIVGCFKNAHKQPRLSDPRIKPVAA